MLRNDKRPLHLPEEEKNSTTAIEGKEPANCTNTPACSIFATTFQQIQKEMQLPAGWFQQYECDRRHTGGCNNPIEVSSGALKGDCPVILNIVRNILEYEKAERALSASEERYRYMFNHMSNAVTVYDVAKNGEEFIFKEINRAAEELDHINREDVIGKPLLTVFPVIYPRYWHLLGYRGHYQFHYRLGQKP